MIGYGAKANWTLTFFWLVMTATEARNPGPTYTSNLPYPLNVMQIFSRQLLFLLLADIRT